MPEIKLRYKKQDAADFSELLEKYPIAELRSPLRSTVPLLAFWRNPELGLDSLSNSLQIDFRDPIELLFEHQVSVRDGKGKASHTDLMVRTATQALAIEAKYTEPGYQSVSKWRDGSEGDNRTKVLGGWLTLINGALGTQLTVDTVAECTYQLIHRTASACAEPADFRAVAYQCFDCDADHRNAYIAQLERLSALVGNKAKLQFVFLECVLERTADYEMLLRQWHNNARDLEPAVRKGLKEDTLLHMKSCTATMVSPLTLTPR
jgi:hypothetical protein